MAEAKKTKSEETQVIATNNAAEECPEMAFALSIDEFCVRQSAIDRRVELIGAFASDQRAKGRMQATQAEFALSYAQFINQPA